MNFGGRSFLITCGVVAIVIISGTIYFLVGRSGTPGSIPGIFGSAPDGGSGQPQTLWSDANGVLTFTWNNLPPNTKLLNVYKEDPKTGQLTFVSSLPVPQGSAASGTISLDIGKKILPTDKLILKANSGQMPGNLPQNDLWQSPTPPGAPPPVPPSSPPGSPPSSPPPPDQPGSPSGSPSSTPPSGSGSSSSSTPPSTPPGTPSSTPSSTPPDNNPPPGNNNPPDNTPSSSPSSSPPNNNPPPGNNPPPNNNPPPSNNPPPNTPPPPPLIPSFQISNSLQWVEVTWQNLPLGTDLIVFSRADNPGGPWEVFYSEASPETTGPYTVKVPIDTPNIPFYYELTTYQNSSVTNVFGPIYLSALQQ